MDLEKLSPAPWTHGDLTGPSPYTHRDSKKAVSVGSTEKDWFVLARMNEYCGTEEDAEFIALARNAFDVMMRRRWHPVPSGDVSGIQGKWVCVGFGSPDFPEKFTYWQDPFTALVEADRWYRENVEAKS